MIFTEFSSFSAAAPLPGYAIAVQEDIPTTSILLQDYEGQQFDGKLAHFSAKLWVCSILYFFKFMQFCEKQAVRLLKTLHVLFFFFLKSKSVFLKIFCMN